MPFNLANLHFLPPCTQTLKMAARHELPWIHGECFFGWYRKEGFINSLRHVLRLSPTDYRLRSAVLSSSPTRPINSSLPGLQRYVETLSSASRELQSAL